MNAVKESEKEPEKDAPKGAGREAALTGAWPAKPLGVAVVGAGYWGPNLVRNFQSSPGFRLRWLCDLNVDRARQVLGHYSTVQATSDYAAVLADPAVDAVAVATPAAPTSTSRWPPCAPASTSSSRSPSPPRTRTASSW